MAEGKRFSFEREDDQSHIEVGLVWRIWDRQRKRVFGWYQSQRDAYEACLWLNATNGKVD